MGAVPRAVHRSVPVPPFREALVLPKDTSRDHVAGVEEIRQIHVQRAERILEIWAYLGLSGKTTSGPQARRPSTRVGFSGHDMYAIAQPAKLKTMLEHLQIAPQVCGHKLRVHKCKVWFPGWDDTPDDGLPQKQWLCCS